VAKTNCTTAQAQEQDAMSDADFESDDEELEDAVLISGEESEGDDGRPAKKVRRGS